tara:strand:+ start:558 stop:1214 length:657 start_codon:yes stop_codon:yes gene_type:complete
LSLLFLNIITSLPDLITKTVETNPYVAYFVISFAMFLENLIPPIPSEIIMPLGGFFVYKGDLNFYILIISGLIGTVVGALPWYFLGMLLNEKKISNFIDRRGKFVGISLKDLDKSRIWFDKYGVPLVFWGRLIPGIRTLISVPAGIELMPLNKFLIWTSLGSLIWVIFLTSAGFLFGENYEIISSYIDNFKFILKPIFAILIILLLIRFFKKNLKNNN